MRGPQPLTPRERRSLSVLLFSVAGRFYSDDQVMNIMHVHARRCTHMHTGAHACTHRCTCAMLDQSAPDWALPGPTAPEAAAVQGGLALEASGESTGRSASAPRACPTRWDPSDGEVGAETPRIPLFQPLQPAVAEPGVSSAHTGASVAFPPRATPQPRAGQQVGADRPSRTEATAPPARSPGGA